LSSYMKIGTILLLAIGIIIVNPRIHMPAVTQFINGGGPIINGKVWRLYALQLRAAQFLVFMR